MKLKDILNAFNLNYPAKFDIFTSICSEFPERCHYLDRFPLLISEPEVYSQVEVFFDRANNNNLLKEYLVEEAKIKNVIKKMWVYNNPVLVQTSLLENEFDFLLKVLNSNKKSTTLLKLKTDLCKQDNDLLFEINNISYLDVLLELGLRERVSSIFIFPIFKTIIWTNDLVMPLYVEDDSHKQLIEKICTVEGVYLRPYKQ
ncbi:hypothetical protein SAMN05660649_00957 [Desulfotomaculum arcticum]|uniref:Uncharacterized protein n=1 Tax=Desulfotruncus arcticus DSM 17038 TaxID=1121424 RepID=A0A1I2PMA1_9FIRM|nr:hypothetical protein [Desulfotruncus arcticus]SFG16720.1 hypothetical protein SAMN05660649_00957 [Desulfotomaculum arcticum] [Desulfotruncus arcticus DSM 17038]